MPRRVEQGHYDSRGNACLKLLLLGAKEGQGQSTTLDAIIDTGFTGFMQIPRKRAASIGVVDLRQSTQVSLADGTTISCPLGLAFARFMDVGQWGMIFMPPDAKETLVGMEFLRTFGLAVVISRTVGIRLYSEEFLAEIVEKMGDLDLNPDG